MDGVKRQNLLTHSQSCPTCGWSVIAAALLAIVVVPLTFLVATSLANAVTIFRTHLNFNISKLWKDMWDTNGFIICEKGCTESEKSPIWWKKNSLKQKKRRFNWNKSIYIQLITINLLRRKWNMNDEWNKTKTEHFNKI